VYKPVNKELVSRLLNSAAQKVARPKSILLVDNDEPSLELLHSLLLKEGDYHVSVARDYEETVHMLSEARFDLMVVNILMPQHEGFMVCAEIGSKKKWCAIPVIGLISKVAEQVGASSWKHAGPFYPQKSELKKQDIAKQLSAYVQDTA